MKIKLLGAFSSAILLSACFGGGSAIGANGNGTTTGTGTAGTEIVRTSSLDEEERIAILERKLEEIDRRLDNMSNAAMLEQVQALSAQVREMRGELEQQQFKIDGVSNRQRELYLDLDTRITTLEGGSSAGLPTASQGETGSYESAFQMLKQARYIEAADRFSQFLKQYPDSEYADNAQYWLSESYYVSRLFDQAQSQFRRVVTQYPDSPKVPDAELKLGFIHYEKKDWGAARRQLNDVISRHPQTTAAQLARQRLTRMDQEGR